MLDLVLHLLGYDQSVRQVFNYIKLIVHHSLQLLLRNEEHLGIVNDNVANDIDCYNLQDDHVRGFFRQPFYLYFQSLSEENAIDKVDHSHTVLVYG